MIVNKKEISEINTIQLELLKEFIKVCKKLKLKYYMVHGSLLGAVKYRGFFPFDDDIDVAMPREDFNILMKKGQLYIRKSFFIQSILSENDYPLVFAKMRDSNTTFIQPILDKLNINKGIYIDIFPIDNFPKKEGKINKLKEQIYISRRNVRLCIQKQTILKRIVQLLSIILCPSWHKAIQRLNKKYSNVKYTSKCIVYGGKESEKNIPCDIFGPGKQMLFEGINVNVPQKYEEYLHIIYGNYDNYSPSSKYMINNNLIEISARIVDINKSYKSYK